MDAGKEVAEETFGNIYRAVTDGEETTKSEGEEEGAEEQAYMDSTASSDSEDTLDSDEIYDTAFEDTTYKPLA